MRKTKTFPSVGLHDSSRTLERAAIWPTLCFFSEFFLQSVNIEKLPDLKFFGDICGVGQRTETLYEMTPGHGECNAIPFSFILSLFSRTLVWFFVLSQALS